MINKEVSIFKSWWSLASPTLARRPSALMLVGPSGIGKTSFGREIAAAMLCESPLQDDHSACGACRSCLWMGAAQHPDFRWVQPDALAAEVGDFQDFADGSEAADAPDIGPEGKKKSQEIRIEQIRNLAGFANVGAHRAGLKVVLINPANRLNYAAANALLKTLEEPSENLMFILVADGLRGIPPTILSRCRRLNLPISDAELSRLQLAKSAAADWLLPALAAEPIDPLRWAERAGKSPPTDVLDLLQRWMNDVARVRFGVPPRHFSSHQTALEAHAERLRSLQRFSLAMAELQRQRAVADHPLNPRLFFEAIFDRFQRAYV
ncbi:MAG: DNA polymerase III subunit delta' [Burkholderiaceae bacterium]